MSEPTLARIFLTFLATVLRTNSVWVIVLAAGGGASCTPASPEPPQAAFSSGQSSSPGKPFSRMAVARPETLPAAEVDVEDEAWVIGVQVQGRARAYLEAALPLVPVGDPLEAMQKDQAGTRAPAFVLNDVLGEIPVSIVCWEEGRACQIFSLASSTRVPLNLAIDTTNANPKEVDPKILLNGQRFRLSDPQLPLDRQPFERTTWGRWKTEHPETDIYLGPLHEG